MNKSLWKKFNFNFRAMLHGKIKKKEKSMSQCHIV